MNLNEYIITMLNSLSDPSKRKMLSFGLQNEELYSENINIRIRYLIIHFAYWIVLEDKYNEYKEKEMKEMSKEEKIEKVIEIISEMTDIKKAATQIIYAIVPPKIKVGMIGKFWDDNNDCMYGILEKIDEENTEPYKSTTCDFFNYFQPMTPEEIKADFEEMINVWCDGP